MRENGMARWIRGMLITAVLALLLGGAGCAFAEQALPNDEEITLEDAALALTCSLNKHVLPAGGKMQFTAAFAAPEKINAQAENDEVVWSVRLENGEKPDASLVKISGSGLLTTAKKIREGLRVTVVCTSAAFGTQAEYAVLVYPPIRRITVKPHDPVVFLGREPAVVSAVTVPKGLERALTWKVANKNIARLKRNPDGTISVMPLRAGSTALTAHADNGVTAQVRLTVLPTIPGVVIEGQDFVRKGGFLDLTARALPRGVQTSGFTWALDVDKSVASITARGRLTASAQCPVGTVITVTCWPKGSDKSVVGTKEIVVTYPRQILDR